MVLKFELSISLDISFRWLILVVNKKLRDPTILNLTQNFSHGKLPTNKKIWSDCITQFKIPLAEPELVGQELISIGTSTFETLR